MLTRRAGRRVAGLGQHNVDLQHTHHGLLQYGVVQQLGAGSSVRQAPLQCTTTQQRGTMLLIECGGADDKTKRTHAVEDIICYSWPLVPYRVGLYLPQGHLSGLGTRCNYSNLSYKRLGCAPLHRGRKEKRLRLIRARPGWGNITPFSRGCMVLCSNGLNHINLRVHCVHL
jgi:hypothetical protein